jgi:hypothetical protein
MRKKDPHKKEKTEFYKKYHKNRGEAAIAG